ncbi:MULTISPECIES: ABC transporter transmembrane domain-containing protein [unclassified Mesorhizobium]|uniref:ABC transporter transmembrane domain-containing protein n=1 Tax=unclassified Mesorhizobium TaxID=325217 RepID=UPI001CCAFF1C|nr:MULTISPECIES: ABC transporter transmembrane domain-containing protein [unclassified Mesorhizobium]MBZ9739976.1 hypothetical protein [Mesorhizobium sp. CO1-1-4]MBZ9806147.1 hypothetical protein [Mesorhizobium sp. ES1-6]
MSPRTAHLTASDGVLSWQILSGGWLGCKATLAIGVQMRLGLFDFLNGQPMKYFAENLAGSVGQRVTATAGNFGALTNIVIWRVAPPAVDFLGTVIVFTIVDWRMAVALASAVVVIMGGLLAFGERGRHLHRTYASYANEVGGSLIDVITNMWSVKAFSARSREHARLAASFRAEADAQRDSWMYTEKRGSSTTSRFGLWPAACSPGRSGNGARGKLRPATSSWSAL